MVADLAGRCRTVADIACDVGLLATAMLEEGRANRAICCDVQPGAVRRARERAARLGLGGRLEARAGDGLSPLAPGEADVIVVAGLGGRTIASILAGRPDVAASARRLALQPMRGAAELRRWLAGRGASFLDEDLVVDGGRYYEAMAVTLADPAAPGGERRGLDETAAEMAGFPSDLPARWVWEAGPVLWRDRHPLLTDALEARAERLARLARALATKPGRAGQAGRLLQAESDMLAEIARRARQC